jgi:acyl carrier protein
MEGLRMSNDTLQRLQGILLPLLRDYNLGDFKPDMRLREELQVDSMFMIEAAVAIEDEFGIPELTDQEMAKLRTVGDVVTLIEDKARA